MTDDVREVCKKMLQKAFARVEVMAGDDRYGYEKATREFAKALGMTNSEMMYIQMNVSTCSEECLLKLAYEEV